MVDMENRCDLSEWVELAKRERKGKPLEELVWTTPEGIPVRSLYTEADFA